MSSPAWIKLPALVLSIVLISEGVAWVIVAPAGNLWKYWTPNAGVSFEAFQSMQVEGNGPDLLFVGDSTGHSNLDPAVAAEVLGENVSVWNLSSSGNFPFAFKETTLPLIRNCEKPPSVLVVSLIPSGFIERGATIKSEASIRSSPICCEEASSGLNLADHIALVRLRHCAGALKFFANGSAQEILDRRGFEAQPFEAKIKNAESKSPPPVMDELLSARLAVLTETAIVCERRGIQFIVSIPPTQEPMVRKKPYRELLEFLFELARDYPIVVFDGRSELELNATDFYDRNHLNIVGARKLTRSICKMIQQGN